MIYDDSKSKDLYNGQSAAKTYSNQKEVMKMYPIMPTQTTKYPMIPPLEIWQPITEKAVPDVCNIYYISTYGRIVVETGNDSYEFVKIYEKPNKYITLRLKTNYGMKNCYLHRLVMLTFNYIDGCEGLDVNHIDGVKSHNFIWNLEWCTRSQNILHALDIGLMGYGEESNASKYKDSQVEMLCGLFDNHVNYKEAANLCGMEPHAAFAVFRGYTWLSVSIKYNFLWISIYNRFSKEQIDTIVSLIVSGDDNMTIALKLIDNFSNLSEAMKKIHINLIEKMRYDLNK
jgi:hypothetical protein